MRTYGVELEIPNVSRQTFDMLGSSVRYEVHDDGSIRDGVYDVCGLNIVPQRHKKTGAPVLPAEAKIVDRTGPEVVTRPYEIATLLDWAKEVKVAFGHLEPTPRASIHVHVDVGSKPWGYIQDLLRWYCWLEEPLYRLSGLGYPHRGQQDYNGNRQDYNYCRPITASIASYWGESHPRPLISVTELLCATTASDMLAAWGRLDVFWNNLGHYVEHRLHGLNIVPIMRQGTVEWRIWNGVYRHLDMILKLIDRVHDLAETGAPPIYGAPFHLDTHTSALGSRKWTLSTLCDILDLDVGKVWGSVWPDPVRRLDLVSHYNNLRIEPVKLVPVRRIRNNQDMLDTGGPEFVLYHRSY